jgi:hypothetical protein
VFHANDHNAPHWSTDFVEHIRTVHFALVAVCLALIGLVQFEKPKDVSTAQFQLQEIKKAVDNWTSDQVAGALGKAFSRWGFDPTLPPENPTVVNANGYVVGLSMDDIILRLSSEEQHSDRIVKWDEITKQPNSLGDFERVWNLFNTPTYLEVLSPNLLNKVVHIGLDGKAKAEIYTEMPTPPKNVAHTLEAWPISDDERQLVEQTLNITLPHRAFVEYIRDNDQTYIFPVLSQEEHRIFFQLALSSTHPYWNKVGVFSSAFPELSSATTRIGFKSFEEIESRLNAEAAKPRADSFEAFGVKFPVEMASRWGIILVVGIQLYLWIHLYELSPKLNDDNPGWDVAWIGVYQAIPARVLFLSSTALLPILTIFILGNHALQNASRVVWEVYICAVVASVVLAGLIAEGVPRRRVGSDAVVVPPSPDQDHRHKSKWLYLVKESFILPMLTAAVVFYLLHGKLKPLAEVLPPPWAEVIAHPIVEILLSTLITLGYVFGSFFVTRLAMHGVSWLIIVGTTSYALMTFTHLSKASIYVLWCGIIWGAVFLLLVRLIRAKRTFARSLEDGFTPAARDYPSWVDDEGNLRLFDWDSNDFFGEDFGRLIFVSLSFWLIFLIGTVVLAMTLWKGIGISGRTSIVVSLLIGVIVAVPVYFVSRISGENSVD